MFSFSMASKNLIQIREVCIVSPNDTHSQFSLPLTFLDLFWSLSEPFSYVFFYEFPEPNTDFLNMVIPNLKKSLSRTLDHYLPIMGHLRWPHDSKFPVVQCTPGDGVSLTIAETKSDFHSLSGYLFRDYAELCSLLPEFSTCETQAPVFALQITLFPNMGFSIGYVAHHAVLDGKSGSLFMHSWAYICKNGVNSVLPPELTPSFDRSFVEQQSEMERIYPRGFGSSVDPGNKSLALIDKDASLPDIMLGTFKMTRGNIDTLKKLVSDYKKEKKLQDTGTRVSTFTISCAYTKVCLIKAKNIKSGKVVLGINVDARSRFEPPIPSTYFGNCLFGCAGKGDTMDYLSRDGFINAVDNIMEGLATLNGGLLKLAANLNKVSQDMKKYVPRDIKAFVVAGSPRFELYKVDFGWGMPKKVDMTSIGETGAFYHSDDRNGNGGVEIGVGLNKHDAELFTSMFVSGLETMSINQDS